MMTVRVGDTVRVVRGDHAHGGKRVGGKEIQILWWVKL